MLAEERALAIVRGVVAKEVEAGLPDRDRARVREQLAQRVEVVVVRRLVRVDAEDREHLRMSVCELERGARALDRRADREDPLHACLARSANELVRRVRARVEVRMGVDHAAVAGASRRGKSGCRRLDAAGRDGLPDGDVLPGEIVGLTERLEDPRRRLREIRRQRDRGRAQTVRERVEHAVELRGVRVVLRELPRLRVGHELVQLPNEIPDRRRARR